jgi:FMN-dependent NADH-azoreductase
MKTASSSAVQATGLNPADAPAVLRRAADLVAEGWAQKTFARTRGGKDVLWNDHRAVCFCATGAVRRASGGTGYNDLPWEIIDAAEAALMRVISADDIPSWNDAADRTQAQVTRALRKAADLAEAEASQ